MLGILKMYTLASEINLPKTPNVAVLGAGPSIKQNIEKIKQWALENDSIVIGCNYKYPIFCDFTIFCVNRMLTNYYKSVKGKIIITGKIRPKFASKYLNSFIFLNMKVKSSGFGALVIARMIAEKNVLVTGFDGFCKKKDDLKISYKHFNNKTYKKYAAESAERKELKHRKVLKKLLKDFSKNNIKVHFFTNDRLKGLNTNLCGPAGIREMDFD